ncbi:hypothetical protein HanXRQr2_Chr14g0666821 [Helianthus annuus]|uniref:Uncharacterized protein n=1 Tax=Helianthus annuus TaxID=4232 RepID=A0A9K3H9I0_HELAN|nr:hypothetical protein HanXRQr2_Chr14g0666821 [Helianthus annuus]
MLLKCFEPFYKCYPAHASCYSYPFFLWETPWSMPTQFLLTKSYSLPISSTFLLHPYGIHVSCL